MEGKRFAGLRWYIMSQWILIVILTMLPYSESACNRINCILCSGNESSCAKCDDGYYVQSGSCVQCPDRCSTCTNSTACTTCADTRWNPASACLLDCSTTCTESTCDDTTGFCDSCPSGKYGPRCKQNCNLCKDGQCDLRNCTNGCKNGYYQVHTDRGYSYCWKCPDNCITCSNTTYCTQCQQGYYRHYYRILTGRGQTVCLQCHGSCLDCSSTEHCHEDCIQQCDDHVTLRTTKSTHESTTSSNNTPTTSLSSNAPRSSTREFSNSVQSTESTRNEACQYLNEELFEELNTCKQQVKTYSEDQYQLSFGHGLATGIGITIVVFGCSIGITLFIRRKANIPNHCFGPTDDHSDGRHEYVNTNMNAILSVTSERSEIHNDNQTGASTSSGVINHYQNIESNREYVSLGERTTQESEYTGLQNT